MSNIEVYEPPSPERLKYVLEIIADDLNDMLPDGANAVSPTNEGARIIGRDRKYMRYYITGKREIQKTEWEAIMRRYKRVCD